MLLRGKITKQSRMCFHTGLAQKIPQVISLPCFGKTVEYAPKITNCRSGFNLVGLVQLKGMGRLQGV